MSKQKAIIVLGMHRSGTSAFAGVLSLLGLNFGKDLMKPATDNEKGYFENNSIYTANEAILKIIGSSWDSLFPLPPNWWQESSLRVHKQELTGIIKREFRDDSVFAIKDPRICRLFPLWQEILNDLNIDFSLIIPVRNPIEVAKSLQKRNNLSFEKATLLWINYVLDAEVYSRKYLRVILPFNDLLNNTRHTIQYIADHLKISFPRNISESMEGILDFLEPNMKHFNIDTKNIDGYLLNHISKCYQAFSSLAYKETTEIKEILALDLLKNEFIKIRDYFYNYDLVNEFSNAKNQIWEKDILLTERERIIEKNSYTIADKDNIIKEKDKLLDIKDGIIEEKNGIIEAKDQRIFALEYQLNDKEQQITGLLDSTSWRITAPVRFAREIFSELAPKIKKMIGCLIKATHLYQNQLPEKEPENSSNNLDDVVAKDWFDFNQIMINIDKLPIDFAISEKPKVSIIIPVYNKIEFTFNCLKSIYDNTSSDVDYEVIVVDDCSTDKTETVLSMIKGIRTLRNKTNLGFLNSCNYAAEQAGGEFLVFLNNDTMVRPGWLNWLLKTFETVPGAGLVGSKLVFPDGRLQEAGGIIWKDGTASHYGRLDDQERPEYNYLREVDYCSGACIMISRELYFYLGKFDIYYSPAYYEDVDLAFKVRAQGRKVLYQPNSVVVHFEGVTSGIDLTKGIKNYQVVNQTKFFDKWRNILAKHAEKDESIEFEKERDIKERMLVIDECVCISDQDAGSLRMLHILKIIQAMGYKITFYPDNKYYLQPYVSNMQGLGIEVLYVSCIGTIEEYLKNNGLLFNKVILSRLNVARKYIDIVKQYCSNAKIIFDTVDLHFLREQREAELKADSNLIRKADKTKKSELEIASKSDVTLVVSPEEKKVIEKEAPDILVKVVSTIQPVYGIKTPFSERSDLLFIGGFRHSPNVDAMIYFVKEVFPHIRKRLTGIKTYIIGSNPPPELKALAVNDIIVTGFIKDIEPYFNQCRVSIAPLRWGAGVKGKINLSMSYGVPVVATPIAVEGMFLVNGEDVLVASNIEEFADAVLELYTNQDLWYKLSDNGLENVRKYFSVEAAKNSLASVLNDNRELFNEPRRANIGS